MTAFISTRIAYPGTSIEALAQVLWMVNGPDWIGASDMARAKVRAKQVESANSAASGRGKAGSATSPAPLRGHGPSSRVKFKAEEIGFTLKTDDKTLREIEAIQEETVKATIDQKICLAVTGRITNEAMVATQRRVVQMNCEFLIGS